MTKSLLQRRPTAMARPVTFPDFEPLEPRLLLAAFHPLSSVNDGAPDSLRAAIIASNTNGEDDVIELGTTEYTLSLAGREEDSAATGDLDIREAGTTLTLRGKGVDLTVINADFIDRVIEVHDNATLILEDLTIRNGEVGDESGGGLRNLGNVTLRNVRVYNNFQTGTSNQAPRGGGGLNSQGTMLIEGGVIEGNIATGFLGGGGIYNTGNLTIRGGTIINGNQANVDGGGIRIAFRTTHIEDAIIENNTAINDGGGIFIVNDTNVFVTLDRVQILNNDTGGDNGHGGGIRNGGMLTITSSTIEGNSTPGASARGGGIYHENQNANLSIMTSSIIGNTGDTGGGIYITSESTFDITRSTIANNIVGDDGGGLWNGSLSSGTLDNSTVSGNQSARGGGGVYNYGVLTVNNTTITNNRADKDGPHNGNVYSGGGGIKGGSDPTLTLHNTIVAGNFSGTGSTAFYLSDISSNFESASSNNVAGDTLTTGVNGNQKIGSQNPGLGPLADNGGPTLTHVILPGSFAENAGDPAYTPFKDQRGLPMMGLVDVGSYELQQAFVNPWDYEVMEAGMFGSTNAGYGFGFDDLRSNSKDADPLFLGFQFDTGPLVVGGITDGLVGDRYGAEIKADFQGRLGFEVGFFIDSGDVFTKYDGSLNYLVDDLGGGEFNVSTVFGVDEGMLSTVSPQIGAYLDLVLELDADISATGCAVGCVSGHVPFKIDKSLEIFSINRQETDAQGNPMHETDGGPVFDDEVRFAKESIFIETNDGTGEKEAKKYAKAKEKENQGKIEEAFAMDDLAKAKTDAQRQKAMQKIMDSQEKQASARTDQGKAAKQAKKNKKLGQQGITLDFNKAEGDLLGFTVGVIGEIGKDKVAARQIPLGGFTVTVPEVELQGADPDFRGTITATTDDITDPVEDAKRQLARLDLDIGGLLGTYAGLPLGKQKVSLGGIVDVEVQTVSYTISPQLNVTQDVASTPYATMVHYDLSRPAEVNLGNGFVTMSSFTIPPEQAFRIKPGDDPIDVTPTLTIANKFTNQIGLDLDLKGALEAFALKIGVLGETLIDIGPLITHNHTLGNFELGNVFDRTFDLAVYDDQGERFEDAQGNPIVYQQPLDGFTIMHAEQDGTSPGTAYRAEPDANNPDLLRITGVSVQNLGMPVFVAIPLVNTDDMTLANTVGVHFTGNDATSAYTLEPEIVIENLVPPGSVTKTVMVDATRWDFNSKTGLDVTNLLDAGVTELIVGFMFDSTGTTNMTFTRSDYQAISDVPADNTGSEGIDMDGVEGNSPDAILQSIMIDVDGNGVTSPLSDGVMVIRYMEGMRGSELTDGAIGDGATRMLPADIEAYIADQLGQILDVDDDGSVDPAADGILIARQLAGFAGAALTDGAINPAGNRTDAAMIDKFLRGERITASNDPVMMLLRDENGNLIMEVPGGAGFEVDDIVSRKGGDPFALEPELQPADDAPAGSSAAKPVTAMSAAQMSAITSGFTTFAANDASTFDLTMFGDEITYIDLYKADASDPDNQALWTFLGTMAEGSPMPFADVDIDIMDPDAVREMSQLLRKVTRTNVLGVDEPVYIEIPDAAGYEYDALDGYDFESIQINPDFGGNLLLDRQFDLYLMNGGEWVYETTITAGEPYMFAAPVAAFRLFGLALPNTQLHRAANDAAPAVITTVGFTLDDSGATPGPVPMVMATELEPRMALTTPEDFAKEQCTGTCGNAFGEPAVLRLVRSGADAELYLNDYTDPVQTYQLSSSTDITVLGDDYKDTLILDTSGGPLRTPLVFHAFAAFSGSDGLVIDGHGVTLDLINRDVVTGVETIDIMGDGSNTLIMDLAFVQNNAASLSTLTILGDADDTANVGAGWTFSTIDGQGMHVFTQGGQTLKVSAALAPQITGGQQALFADLGAGPAAPPDMMSNQVFSESTSPALHPLFEEVSSTQDVQTDAVVIGDAQVVSASPQSSVTALGEAIAFDVDYASTPATGATGLSLRIHFDSTKLHFEDLTNVLPQGSFTQQVQSEGASGIADTDPATDMFVNLLWLDITGDWPDTQPATLFTANFTPVGDFTGETDINFTGDPAPGFDAVIGDPVHVIVTATPMPALTVAGASVIEGDSGQTDAEFVVTLSEAADQDVTVNYATSDESATAGEDYEATSGQLLIPAGQTMGVITVPVFGDVDVENDETFVVTLSDAAGAVLATATAIGTIVSDESPPPTPHVSIDDVTLDEGDAGTRDFTFTVTLDSDPLDTVTLALTINEGTATVADNDLIISNGQVTFQPGGNLTQTFTVQVNGDTQVENNETFTVDVAAISGTVVIDDAQGLGTIINDDVPPAAPHATIDDVTLNEGDAGNKLFTFTVTLDRDPIDAVTLALNVNEGTATVADNDLSISNGQLIFQPGGTLTQTFTVQVHGDLQVESNETFTVDLTTVSGSVVIDDAQGVGTILNDDLVGTTPHITIDDVSGDEGNGSPHAFTFTVTLDRPPVDTITLDVTVLEGTATAVDGDAGFGTGMLTFTPTGGLMQQINVLVFGDVKPEPDETFTVDLSLTSGTAVFDKSAGVGTIINDDGEPPARTLLQRIGEGPSGNGSFKFEADDAFLNTFQFTYKGGGFLDIFQESDGRISLALVSPDAKTTLLVKNTGSGDGMLAALDSDAGFKSGSLKHIGFLGDILVAGYVGAFEAGVIADQHTVSFGGSPLDKPSKFKFEQFTDVNFTSTAPVDFTILHWLDTDPQANRDSFTVPWVKKIDVKGDRHNIARPGTWSADITADGAGAPKGVVLSSLKANELAAGLTMTLDGIVKKVDIKSAVSDLTLDITDELDAFTFLGGSDINIHADDIGKVRSTGSWMGGAIEGLIAGAIEVKANRKAPGDVGAISDVMITLAGIPAGSRAKAALGKITSDGHATGVTMNITDDIGSIEFKGDVDNLDVTASSAIKKAKLGAVSAADVRAGSVNSIDVVQWLDGELIATDIKSIKTRGDKKTNTTGDFGPNVTVNEAGASTEKSALGSVAIKGTLSGAWAVTGVSGASRNSAAGKVQADAIAANYTAQFLGDVGAFASQTFLDGFVAAFNFGKVDVKTSMTGATVIAGGNSSSANTIGSIKVGGDVSNATRILVGVDPVNNILDDGDDTFKPGDANFIKSMTIGGVAALDSVFQAGAFPKTVSINKAKVDPLLDPRFFIA